MHYINAIFLMKLMLYPAGHGCKVRGLEIMSDFMCLCNFIIHYSFSRHFYPKRLTIEEYNKRVIIKRQRDTGSACNTKFQVLFRVNTSRA